MSQVQAQVINFAEYRERATLRAHCESARPREFLWIVPNSGLISVGRFQPSPVMSAALSQTARGKRN